MVVGAENVNAVQSAVVMAVNTLGVTLVGSKFTPITASPIPDDEVAQILAESLPVGVESAEEKQ